MLVPRRRRAGRALPGRRVAGCWAWEPDARKAARSALCRASADTGCWAGLLAWPRSAPAASLTLLSALVENAHRAARVAAEATAGGRREGRAHAPIRLDCLRP